MHAGVQTAILKSLMDGLRPTVADVELPAEVQAQCTTPGVLADSLRTYAEYTLPWQSSPPPPPPRTPVGKPHVATPTGQPHGKQDQHRGAGRRAPAVRRTRRVGGGRRLKMVAGTGLGEEGTVVGR